MELTHGAVLELGGGLRARSDGDGVEALTCGKQCGAIHRHQKMVWGRNRPCVAPAPLVAPVCVWGLGKFQVGLWQGEHVPSMAWWGQSAWLPLEMRIARSG